GPRGLAPVASIGACPPSSPHRGISLGRAEGDRHLRCAPEPVPRRRPGLLACVPKVVRPVALCLALGAYLVIPVAIAKADTPVEQWGVAEVVLRGPSEGNPFTEVTLSARVSLGDHAHDVAGFYDGEGVYRVRFMPDRPGTWHYTTTSNRPELDGKTGQIEVGPPSPGNHGPVRVRGTFHFTYADGTPYLPIGTTCYAWTHQGDSLGEQTLDTLKHAPFNN